MTDERSFPASNEHPGLGASLAALLVRDHAVGVRGRSVIAVAGESGSGKSVTAVGIASALDSAGIAAAVLHQDDYFIRPPRANHAHRVSDLTSVGPQEVNLARLASHITAFRAGATDVELPLTDYATDRFLQRSLDFSGLGALVVEGTYALLLEDADVRIFLEATSEESSERRRLRNRDIDEPIVDRVLAIEHQLIAPQAAQAHILVDRHFQIRAHGAPLTERATRGPGAPRTRST